MKEQLDPITGLPESSEGLKRTSSFSAADDSLNLTLPGTNRVGEFSDIDSTGRDKGLLSGMSQAQNRADGQHWSTKVGNSLANMAGEVVGGTIEGIGYLFDFEQHLNLINNTEQEFSNWFSDIGKDLKSTVEENFPIYEELPGEWNPGDIGWWAKNGVSVASTLSLMVPAVGATRLLGAGGKAIGAGTKFMKGQNAINASKGLTGAMVSRYMENTMEASGVFESVYQQLIDEGVGEDEAKMRAGDAASKSWYANSANLLWDIPQYLLLFKTPKNIANAGLAKKSVLDKKRIQVPFQMVTEGAEEVGQYIIGQEAEKSETGDIDFFGEGFMDRVYDEYARDGELWTSALFGALGGGVFSAAGSVLKEKQEKRFNENPHIKLMDAVNQAERAAVAGDAEALKAIQDNTFIKTAFSHASRGQLDLLKQDIDALAATTQEELDAAGMTREELNTIVAERKADLEFFEQTYNTIQNDNSIEQGVKVAKINTAMQLRYATKQVDNLEGIIQQWESSQKDVELAKIKAYSFRIASLQDFAKKNPQYADIVQNEIKEIGGKVKEARAKYKESTGKTAVIRPTADDAIIKDKIRKLAYFEQSQNALTDKLKKLETKAGQKELKEQLELEGKILQARLSKASVDDDDNLKDFEAPIESVNTFLNEYKTAMEGASTIEEKNKIRKEYATKANDRIIEGTPSASYYEFLKDDFNSKLEEGTRAQKELEAKEAKDLEKPQHKVIFRAEEQTQVFIDFVDDATKEWFNEQPIEYLKDHMVIEVRDYAPASPEAPTVNKNVSVKLGLTSDQTKGVYVVVDGRVVGGLKDPNRFLLKGKSLNIMNPAHLEQLNPSFVLDGEPTEAGRKVQAYYLALNEIWKEIYAGKTILTNSEVNEKFFINKTAKGTNYTVGKGYLNPSDRPKLSDRYNESRYNLKSLTDKINGIAIVRHEVGEPIEFFVKAPDGNVTRIDPRNVEVIEAIEKMRNDALDKLKDKKVFTDGMGQYMAIVNNGTGPQIISLGLPPVIQDVADDRANEIYQTVKEELEALQEEAKKFEDGLLEEPPSGKTVMDRRDNSDAKINDIFFTTTKGYYMRITTTATTKNGKVKTGLAAVIRDKNNNVTFITVNLSNIKNLKALVSYVNGQAAKRAKNSPDKFDWLNNFTLKDIKQDITPPPTAQLSNLVVNYDITYALELRPKNISYESNKAEAIHKKLFNTQKKFIKGLTKTKTIVQDLEKLKERIKKGDLASKDGVPIDYTEIEKKTLIALINAKLKEFNPPKEEGPVSTEQKVNAMLALLGGDLTGAIEATSPESKEEIKKEVEEVEKTVEKEGWSDKDEAQLKAIHDRVTSLQKQKDRSLKRKKEWPAELEQELITKETLRNELRAKRSSIKGDDTPQDLTFKVSEDVTNDPIDLNEAMHNLNEILPIWFNVQEIDQNLANVGLTWGAFANFTIYLHQQAGKGTEYHEAFHAIFRTLLNDKQIARYYKSALKRWGEPSAIDIKNLRYNYPRATENDLKLLWLEEKMADSFQDYAMGRKRSKVPGFLYNFFRKLKELFNAIIGRKDELDLLFRNIYTGSFASANVQNNVFSGVSQPVYSLIIGQEENAAGHIVAKPLTVVQSNRIINTVATRAFDKMQNEGTSFGEAFEKEFENIVNYYDLSNWNTELDQVEEINEDRADEIIDKIEDIQNALTLTKFNDKGEPSMPNKDLIKAEAEKRIKLFSLDTLENEALEDFNEDDSSPEGWQRNANEIGGFKHGSKLIKQLFGFATMPIDEFGFGRIIDIDTTEGKYQMTADGMSAYDGVERTLANTPKKDMLRKFYHFVQTNKNSEAVYNDLINKIRAQLPEEHKDSVDILSLPYDVIKQSNWFNLFASNFQKDKVTYQTTLYDTNEGRSKTFNANVRDVKVTQFNKWAKNFESKKLTKDEVKALFNEINSKFNNPLSYSGEHGIEEAANEIKKLFNQMGIELSVGYIKFSIIANHRDQFLEDERKSIDRDLEELELTDEQREYLESLIEYQDLYEGVVPYDLSKEATTGIRKAIDKYTTPAGFFVEEVDEKGKVDAESGIIGRLKTIADSNAVFDETVGNSTFQNAEGKTIYDKIFSSYYTSTAIKWRNKARRAFVELYQNGLENEAKESLRKALLKEGTVMNDYDLNMYYETIKNNPLLNSEIADLIFKNFKLHVVDGIREENLDAEGNKTYGSIIAPRANAFRKLDQRGKLLMPLIYFADSGSSVNKRKVSGEIKDFRFFNIGVNAEKSTAYLVELPVENYFNNQKPLSKAVDTVYGFFKQETDRIERVKQEIEDIKSGAKTTDIIKGYHYGRGKDYTKARGLQLFHFKGFEELIGAPEAEVKAKIEEWLQEQLNEYVELLKTTGVDKILPSFYRDSKGELDMNRLGNYFMNDYINTFSFTQLIDGESSMMFKNPVDYVKRNSGKVASGPDMGDGTTTIATVTSVELDITDDTDHGVVGSADTTDAQTLGTVNWYVNTYLANTGKLSQVVKDIYKKINRGITITQNEELILKNLNAQMNPRKIVQRDMISYIKTSLHTLSRGLTSYTNRTDVEINDLYDAYEAGQATLDEIHAIWRPLPGREKLHDLLNEMEKKEVDLLVFDSASKMATRDVGADTSELNPYKINNNTIREQVKTDGMKTEIVDGTQKLGLVWSEQDPTTDTSVYGNKTNVGAVVRVFDKLLAKRVNDGTDNIRKKLFKFVNGKLVRPDYKYLYKKFKASLEASNVDPWLLELFSVIKDGPKYNWNLPAIETKFQNMYLAAVSKGSLKHKAPGTKYTLVSDFGMEVIEHEGKVVKMHNFKKHPGKYKGATSRRLRHRIPNGDGTFYSEMIVSKAVLDYLQVEVGQTLRIPAALAKQMGVRIPTQDKHSMINLKIVDVTDSHYGNMVIMPQEVVILSGADFDIDSLYARFFKTGRNKKQVYGKYLTSENPYDDAFVDYLEEYMENNVEAIREHMKAHPDYPEAKRILDEKYTDLEAVEMILYGLEPDSGLQKIRFEVLRELADSFEVFMEKNKAKIDNNIKALKENIDSYDPLTLGELNNTLLELETVLVHNNGNRDIAATPATMDAFKDLVNELEADFGIKSQSVAKGVHSPLDKSTASNSIDVGANGIGPAALFNILFQRLKAANISISEKRDENGDYIFPSLMGKRSFDSYHIDGKRINDYISTILSAMTDNAKEQLAAQFNLTTETLSTALTMIGMQIPFDTTMLMMKQDVIKNISDSLLLKKSTLLSKKEKDSFRGKTEDAIIEEIISDFPKFTFTGIELSRDNLIKALQYNQGLEVEGFSQDDYYSIQVQVAQEFAIGKKYAAELRKMTKVLSLIKGLKPTWVENYQFSQAIKDLGLAFKSGKIINTEKINDLPFNFANVLDTSQFLTANLLNFNKLLQDAKHYFILHTNMANKIMDVVKLNFKEGRFDFSDNFNSLRTQLLAFLQMKAYKNLYRQANPLDINDLFSGESHELLLKLLETDEYKNNRLLKFIKKESFTYENGIFKGKTLHKLTGNTRTQKNPDLVQELIDSYKTLFYGTPEARRFALLFRDYIYLKDSAIFRQNSLIRQLDPYFLSKIAEGLTEVQKTLANPNKENVQKTFGLDEKDLISEFLELFSRYGENSFNLYSNKKAAIIKGSKKIGNRKGDIEGFNYPIFVSDDIITVNLFAGGKANVKENKKIISSGLFQVTDNGFFFPKFVKVKDGKNTIIYKLEEYIRNPEGYKAGRIKVTNETSVEGIEALYRPVSIIGSKEILPYALTSEEWAEVNKQAEAVKQEEKAVEQTDAMKALLGNDETGSNSLLGLISDIASGKAPKDVKEKKELSEDKKVNAILDILNGKNPDLKINEGPAKDVNESLIIPLLDKLKEKFGYDYVIEPYLPASVGGKVDYKNKVIRINPNSLNAETAFHEYAHIFIDIIQITNPDLYRKLMKEGAKLKGIIPESVEKQYLNSYAHAGMSFIQRQNQLQTERIVTAIGQYAAGQFDNKSKVAKLIEKFLEIVSALFRNIINDPAKVIIPEKLDPNMTIREIGHLMLNSEKINFGFNNNEVDDIINKYSKCD